MALCNVLKSFTSPKIISLFVITKRYRYYWEARPENKWRKKMMMITLPRLGRMPDYEPVKVKTDDDKLYGLDVVLHREATEALFRSRMIAVFLQTQMEITEYYRLRHELRKVDIFIDNFPNHVMEQTLRNTHLECLLNLYEGQTLTVYSDSLNVKDLIKISKKNPYVALLGGVIDNYAMSANQMMQFSKLPAIDVLQSQLSFTLSSHCSSTRNLLQRNQSNTVGLLSQYIKDKDIE